MIGGRTTGAWFFVVSLAVAGCSGGAGTDSKDPATSPPPAPAPSPTPTPTPTDQFAPSIRILSPATTGTYSTTASSVSINGDASDDVGVTQISWQNDRGGSGQATPGSNWSINGIALQLGDNRITVTARDESGKSGSAAITVSYVSSSTTTLNGIVDSSFINRSGVNAVYIYQGNVVPDDIGAPGANPMALAAVVQDIGACSWRFHMDGLPPGPYTVAFTNQAGSDNASTNDAISFVGSTTVTLRSGNVTTQNFAPATIWRVGPTRTYKRPSDVSSLVSDGAVVEIDSGTYLGDVTNWRANNLTLRGVGGRARLDANGANYGGKGTWVMSGRNTTVENIEFSNATVPDQNGAGIRQDGPGLTVCNSYFHDNENGILGGSGGDVLIEFSEFAQNGYGDGQSHNMYISGGTNRFTFRYSYSHHARIGHNIKTRARENYILYSRVMDEASGTSSYAIDVPDCGVTYIVGNSIQQGPNTDNSTVISYGAEACNNGNQQLFLANNTIVNDRNGGSFLYARGGTAVTARNNLLVGTASVPGSIEIATQNLKTDSPAFFDRANFDYHLTAASPRNNAVPPGTGNGLDLTPLSQYVHPISYEARPSNGALDMGAFEYAP